MPVLAKMLGTDVSKLILRLYVVDTDSSFLDLFLHEEEAQSNVFHSRAISLVAGDVKSRGVVDVHRYSAEAGAKSQLLHHIGAKHCLLHCQSGGHELCLHGRLCRQPLQPHLEADRAIRKKRYVGGGRFSVVGVVTPVCVGERR